MKIVWGRAEKPMLLSWQTRKKGVYSGGMSKKEQKSVNRKMKIDREMARTQRTKKEFGKIEVKVTNW